MSKAKAAALAAKQQPVTAPFAVGASVTLAFEVLNETPGAVRLQEYEDGTPLVSDADGAKVGALYLRKAAFGEMQEGAKYEVSIKRVS